MNNYFDIHVLKCLQTHKNIHISTRYRIMSWSTYVILGRLQSRKDCAQKYIPYQE